MNIQLLSITHAAEVLDCSRGHIYGLISAGKLRAVETKAKGTRSKTRIYAEDLEAFIAQNTRRVGTGSPATTVGHGSEPLPSPLDPQLRPELYADVAGAPTNRRDIYSTGAAAKYAGVHLNNITAALKGGTLHGRRRTPGSPWRINHECLQAWREGRSCGQEGGGGSEVRRSDGT